MTAAHGDPAWDVVVVGGGSAGCVLARRLSDDPSRSVLLVEAGGEARSPAVRIPALIPKISSELNWLYPVGPDASRDGRVDPYGCGRCLGGSSAISAMMWVRGHRDDYDGWAAAGCAGWAFDDVLPYFRRCERFEDGPSAARGGSGPQHVARTRVRHRLLGAFAEAAEQDGLPRLSDYNAGGGTGVALSQVTQRRGLRETAADAFLRPVRRRPNLTIWTHAQATRVLVEDGRASGVEVQAGDGRRIARARGVVLSAGAIGSPRLLLLSGIGPRADLVALGVAVVADSPNVGRNLQDHPACTLVFDVGERTLNQDVTPLRLLRHGLDFALRGRGALTATSNHVVAFDRLDRGTAGPPELELIFIAFGLAPAGGEGEASDRRPPLLQRLTARTGGRAEARRQAARDPLVTVQAVLLHPRSRGTVALRSPDPAQPPEIRFDLLAERADVAALTEAARRVRRIMGRPGIARSIVGERVPGERVASDPDWERYVRETAFRLCHPSSTCAMGAGDQAVVDSRLRVRGVPGLRVVDASVMPSLPSGNTNAPVMMLAERAADLIAEDAARAR